MQEILHGIERYNAIDDSALYTYLSKTRPEGKIKLNPQEKLNFEKWLDLKNR